jgi:hypothetical protein
MIIEMNEMTDGVGGQKGWEFWGHSSHFYPMQSFHKAVIGQLKA